MEIWRVENKNGDGCYRNNPYTMLILARHKNPITHPTPRRDIRINRNPREEEITGFLEECQARYWFNPSELAALRELGFHLKKVPVERVTAVGSYQVLAIR